MIVLSTVIGLVHLQMKGEDSKTVIVSDGSEGTVAMRSKTAATQEWWSREQQRSSFV